MQLRNKYYPYPVIVEDGDYYNESTFVSEVKYTMDGYNIKLVIKVCLSDDMILQMINDGQAIYAHHIECPQTCYRKVIKTSSNEIEFLLKDLEVNGVVQICSFVVANKDIEKYTNNSFSADYKGWKFNIEKGCIMAIGNQYNLHIDKIRDDLVNTESIFSIVKNVDQLESNIKVDLGEQKIIISLPEKIYNQYYNIQSYIDVQPIMHSMIIIPALVYTFSELRADGEQLYDREGNRWFRGLRKACKGIDITLNEETLKGMDILKVSQQLLDNPIIKAIEYFSKGGDIHEN